MEYDFRRIEKDWQKKWKDSNAYKVFNPEPGEGLYLLIADVLVFFLAILFPATPVAQVYLANLHLLQNNLHKDAVL